MLPLSRVLLTADNANAAVNISALLGFPMLMNIKKHLRTFQIVSTWYMTDNDKQKYLQGKHGYYLDANVTNA